MKNLKRALSFALASVMLVGMMVVGAGAVDFGDADEIVNTEAVQTMVALGVINGKDTGNFDPEGIVTRAEMAKIICVMLNGGKDVTGVTKADPSYTDIKGHWAEGYIEYCSALGIIAGRGDGTFQPDGTVTGTEAAKMLLVALGYDSDVFEFTGANWAIKVNSKANEIKLYDGIEHITVDAGLTRDNTAQMAYNTLDAFMMSRTYDKVLSNGEISYNYTLSSTTFLKEKFDADTFVGTMVGNYDTGAANNEGEIAVYGKLDTDSANTSKRTASFPSDLSISNIGEEVKIIFKDGKGGTAGRPDKNDTIYGAFNTGATEVYNVTKNDIQDSESTTKIKFGGAKYDVADSVEVITNYITGNTATYTSAATLQSAIKVQSVDAIKFVTDEDGKISKAYITEYAAGRVTAVTKDKVTISGVGSITLEDNDVYEGIAKDDVVVYTKFYDTDKDEALFTVTEAETVEGELTGFKKDGTPSTYKNVVVDGTTYKVNAPATTIPVLTDDYIDDPSANDNIGDDVRLYLVGGMVAAIELIDESESTYALITEVDYGTVLGSEMNPVRVTLLYSDGTKETKVLHKDSTTDGSTAVYAGDNAQGDNANIHDGDLVKYTTSGDKVKISAVKTGAAITASDASGAAKVWDKDTKKLTHTGTTSAVAANNAVLFVKVNSDYYAYDLRSLNNISNTTGTGVTVGAMFNSDGLVVAAYAELGTKPGSNTADTLYGIVTAYVGTRKIDDDTYYQYTVAVGRDELLTVNVDDNTSIKAGNLVIFDEKTDSLYDGDVDFTVLTSSAAIAVKSYNDASKLLTYYNGTSRADANSAFDGTGLIQSTTVDDDVVIRYVNADDKKAGDEIGVNAFDGTTGFANAAIYDVDGDGLADVIFVETSGEVNLLGNTAFGAVTKVTVSSASATGDNASAYTLSDPGDVEVGASFTVTVSCTGIDSANAKETVTVTYNGTAKVLTFTSASASSQSVSFTAAAGQTSVTAAVVATAK